MISATATTSQIPSRWALMLDRFIVELWESVIVPLRVGMPNDQGSHRRKDQRGNDIEAHDNFRPSGPLSGHGPV